MNAMADIARLEMERFRQEFGWEFEDGRCGPRRKPGETARLAEPMWKQGVPVAEIAELLDVTPHAIRMHAWRNGWPKRKRPSTAEKERKRREAYPYFKAGATSAEVARILGISKRTACQYRRELGL